MYVSVSPYSLRETRLKLNSWIHLHICAVEKCIHEIILHFEPVSWYPTLVKDGVLKWRGLQALCGKVYLLTFPYGFTVTAYQYWQPKICVKFIEADIQWRFWG